MDPAVAVPARPAPRARLTEACQALRGHRLPWIATAWGTGIGIYFALPVEPTGPEIAFLACLAAIFASLAWTHRAGAGLLPLLVAVALCGLLAAAARTATVAGPVLDFRYYGAVEGRVLHVDRSSSGAVRITLDRVRLDGVAPDATPRRVRLSLHGGGEAPRPGARVMTTAHLSAPNGPAEPGGFDFQRHAWFLRLGAVGYARVPLLTASSPEGGWAAAPPRVRTFLADGLRDRLPGARGEVAAALVAGDRSGLPEDVVEALRRSNLAHLLAISGLHMGLLVGFVFWAVRAALAAWPRIALTAPIRVHAAMAALPVATAYLLISGGSVATQRAYIMAVVLLGAIMLGRRALSMRSVAIAAVVVLAWRPETLTGPGFQMSFAATAALVLAFRALSARRESLGGWMHGWRGALLGLFVSSLVAGLATAPIAALHFNRIGHYGLLANLLAVPAMGTLVMPPLLIAVLLWPVGLEAAPLWLAGEGIGWIVGVAERVSALPGAVSHVPAPGPWVLPLLGLGMATVACARGRGRAAGAVMAGAAFALWMNADRPDMLISADGRLVGTMTADGRWLSRESGAGFAADIWLENDGDGTPQRVAATRAPTFDALPSVTVLRGKTGLDAALDGCAADGSWLVTPVPVARAHGSCEVFDATRLRRTGAVALHVGEGGARLVTAADLQGLRPWTAAYRRQTRGAPQ